MGLTHEFFYSLFFLKCPGCPYGGLDMSTGLFQFFAPLSVGVLYGSWVFDDDSGGGGGGGNNPPPAPPPPTTHHDPPPPTTTWKPTTTWEAKSSWTPTTTKSWSSSKKTEASSSSSSSSSSLTVAANDATGSGTAGDVIGNLNQVLIGMGGMAMAN